jgi:hypothetical protein
MSEDYEHTAEAQMAQAFSGLAGTVQGMAMGLYDRHEYKMVPVDDLSEHGADRWRVVPVPPAQEITQGLTGPRAGPLMFLMERQVLVDDTPGGI